jgi:hypothetical protein
MDMVRELVGYNKAQQDSKQHRVKPVPTIGRHLHTQKRSYRIRSTEANAQITQLVD